MEVRLLRLDHRVHSAHGVEVYYGHAPHVAGLLHCVNVGAEVLSAHVLPALVGLQVLCSELGAGTVYRRKQHYLLVGEECLEAFHCYVYASLERGVVHRRGALLAFVVLLRTVHRGQYCILALVIPAAEGHSRVEVVSPDEHRYGVNVVAVLILQRLCLPWHVVPLAAADGIDVGRYAEPFLQKVPVFLVYFLAVIPRVGHRVAYKAYPLARPGVAEGT